jgi:hypothetical protein
MTAESSTLASATSRTAPLSRRLEILENCVLREVAPLKLPRDVAAQHRVEFALQLDRKRDLGAREKIPARRPCRVTRIGVLERRSPVALSRNSRTVLILMWPPW